MRFSIMSNFMLVSSRQSPVNLVSWSTKLPWKIKLWTIDSLLCFWVCFELFGRQKRSSQTNCIFWGCYEKWLSSVLSFVIVWDFSKSLFCYLCLDVKNNLLLKLLEWDNHVKQYYSKKSMMVLIKLLLFSHNEIKNIIHNNFKCPSWHSVLYNIY